MSRLIDADVFKAYMQDKYVLFDNTLADIDAQPTVDAVEIVRCKECMYLRYFPLTVSAQEERGRQNENSNLQTKSTFHTPCNFNGFGVRVEGSIPFTCSIRQTLQFQRLQGFCLEFQRFSGFSSCSTLYHLYPPFIMFLGDF